MAKKEIRTSTGKLRQFFPEINSRAIITASVVRKDKSKTAAAIGPIEAAARKPNRPASQKDTNKPNRQPLTGRRPVQFGIAVRIKPAIAAPAKPNSISC